MQQFTNTLSTQPVVEDEQALDLIGYWRVIQRRKGGILGLAGILTLLVIVIVSMMTPIYSSTVTILVEQTKAKMLSIDEVYSGVSSDQAHYQTQVEMLTSNALMEGVVDRLDLLANPVFNPPAKASLSSNAGVSAAKISAEDMRHKLARKLLGMVTVEPSKKSQLIKLTVTSSDRELAAVLANTIAEVYIDMDLEARYKMTQKATGSMNVQLVELKSKLDKSEQVLQQYRDEHHIISSVTLELGGAASQLSTNMANLSQARVMRAQAQATLEQVKKASGHEESLPMVQRNPMVMGLMNAVTDRERTVETLSNRYGKDHPKLIQAQSDLKKAKEDLRLQVVDVVSGLQREYELAKNNESILSGAVSEAKQTIQGSNQKEFALQGLEREVKTNLELYDMFMAQLKSTRAVSDLQSVVARVVDPALPGSSPIKPKKQMVISLAFVLSLMLGVAVAFLLEHLDNSVRSTEDAERKIGLPLLAAVPKIELAPGKTAGMHYLDAPKSLFSEGIKTIRTGILLSGIDHPKKMLLVTSSVPGEGKSTIAINLAMAHAQTKKVLLIDADMRRPSIAKVLGLDNTHPGLSMLALGLDKLENCVYKIEGSNLDILSAGSIPPNPLELLLSERFKELLAGLTEMYDTVIIDSPPVQLVSDAVVLASMATGVVFVVKADSTPFQMAKRGIRALQRGGASIYGTVLNQSNFKNEEYYGSYGKYNYHAYYGEDADKAAKA